jgi:hypothetical protein
VPASVSSPIAVLSAHGGLDGLEPDADLLVALAGVPDPRKARGCRHRLVTVLAVAVCAVLAAARSSVAIAEWAHDLPVSARLRLGLGRRPPRESTIRRILRRVDLDALDATLSSWLAAPLPNPPPGRVRVVAVDGEDRSEREDSPRCPRRGRAHVHLLAAFDPASGVVLGQTQVDGKSNEVRREAPCRIPDSVRWNLEDSSWVRWLTRSRKADGDQSMVRHEAPCRIPHSVGRNLEGCSWA